MQSETATGLNFRMSETQQMIAETVRDFCAQYISPYIMEWDEAQTFPREVFRKLGDLGLMGVLVPQAYGGAGLTYTEYVMAIKIGRAHV